MRFAPLLAHFSASVVLANCWHAKWPLLYPRGWLKTVCGGGHPALQHIPYTSTNTSTRADAAHPHPLARAQSPSPSPSPSPNPSCLLPYCVHTPLPVCPPVSIPPLSPTSGTPSVPSLGARYQRKVLLPETLGRHLWFLRGHDVAVHSALGPRTWLRLRMLPAKPLAHVTTPTRLFQSCSPARCVSSSGLSRGHLRPKYLDQLTENWPSRRVVRSRLPGCAFHLVPRKCVPHEAGTPSAPP